MGGREDEWKSYTQLWELSHDVKSSVPNARTKRKAVVAYKHFPPDLWLSIFQNVWFDGLFRGDEGTEERRKQLHTQVLHDRDWGTILNLCHEILSLP